MSGNRLACVLVGCVCVPLGSLHKSALAEPASLESTAPVTFDSAVQGAIVDAGIGTSADGDTLMFEVGGEWAGVKTFRDGSWLLQWDALLAGRGGYLANQHPYFFLIGGKELAWAEAGYRFSGSGRWSPYLGGRLGNDARIMAHPGLALSAFDTVNNADRVGGDGASGLIRVDVGASFLDAQRSLLLVAFVEEALRAREINTGGQALAGVGIAARFDIAHSVATSVEIIRGVTPTRTDQLRGSTDQTTRTGGAAAFRKVFHNQMWFGASVFLERDTDHIVYAASAASAATYNTASAPWFGMTVLYGLPLWNGRMK